MHTYPTDTATPIVVDFHATRVAAGKHASHRAGGTDVAAHIFMACLAMLFVGLVAFALRTSFAGGTPAPKPRTSHTYCTSLRWDTPFPYGNCFIVPGS